MPRQLTICADTLSDGAQQKEDVLADVRPLAAPNLQQGPQIAGTDAHDSGLDGSLVRIVDRDEMDERLATESIDAATLDDLPTECHRPGTAQRRPRAIEGEHGILDVVGCVGEARRTRQSRVEPPPELVVACADRRRASDDRAATRLRSDAMHVSVESARRKLQHRVTHRPAVAYVC